MPYNLGMVLCEIIFSGHICVVIIFHFQQLTWLTRRQEICVLVKMTYLNQEQLKTQFLFTGLCKEPHTHKSK